MHTPHILHAKFQPVRSVAYLPLHATRARRRRRRRRRVSYIKRLGRGEICDMQRCCCYRVYVMPSFPLNSARGVCYTYRNKNAMCTLSLPSTFQFTVTGCARASFAHLLCYGSISEATAAATAIDVKIQTKTPTTERWKMRRNRRTNATTTTHPHLLMKYVHTYTACIVHAQTYLYYVAI